MIHIAECFPTPGEGVTWLFLHHLILSFYFASLIDEDEYFIILICITSISSKTMFSIYDSLSLKELMIISLMFTWHLFKLWLIFFYQSSWYVPLQNINCCTNTCYSLLDVFLTKLYCYILASTDHAIFYSSSVCLSFTGSL